MKVWFQIRLKEWRQPKTAAAERSRMVDRTADVAGCWAGRNAVPKHEAEDIAAPPVLPLMALLLLLETLPLLP